MGNTTTYGDINQRTAAYAQRKMLTHAEPRLILSKMGNTEQLPSNTATTVKFRRPNPFAVSVIPLAEGVTPTPQKMAYTDIQVTVRQYGGVVEFSDYVIATAEDPVLANASMMIGEQAAATVEQIIYAAIRGGTNVVYANGASRSAVNTVLTLNKQRAVTRQLDAQKAQKITRILDSGPNYGVHAVEASYVAVAHTDLDSDIRNLAGFISVANYGQRKLISDYEIGTVESVRYVLSPDLAPFKDAGGTKGSMVSTSGTSADVYPIIYLGMDAYAQVPLKGMNNMTPMVHNPKVSDSDPLAQRGYVGYKFATAAVILNELWLCRLECAATAL